MPRYHLHLYYCDWTHESRAWRAGTAALEHGFADQIIYAGYRVAGLPEKEEIAAGQTVRRIGPEPSRPGSPRLKRALSLPRWWQACQNLLYGQEIGLVTAHSLASLPGAAMLARRTGAPLIYDAHELESERQGWAGPVRWAARVLEGHFIRQVDHTLAVSDTIRDWYATTYPNLAVSTLRNVPELGHMGSTACSLREDLGLSKSDLVYAYCGAFGGGRGLIQLIDAFRAAPRDRHLVLVGYGPLESELRSRAENLPNVHIHPAVPSSELVAFLSGADVGVFVPDGQSLSYQYCLPNKVFEYAAAGLALLLGPGPELARFAAGYPAARLTAPDADVISAVLHEWDVADIRGQRPALEAFSPPNWATEKSKLLDIYGGLLRP